MRRADRLFDIVQALRGGRTRTGSELARLLEVSVRTIYRDIATLIASGVPIEGEAGVGYVLRPGFLLPPLTLTEEERQALVLGARLVTAWADGELGRSAEEALVKLEAVGAAAHLLGSRAPPLHSHALRLEPRTREHLATARRALQGGVKLDLRYATPGTGVTSRRVRPLSLDFWGHGWTLTAWCELRDDFRCFRLDRMDALQTTSERFAPAAGRTLADYMSRLGGEGYGVGHAAI